MDNQYVNKIIDEFYKMDEDYERTIFLCDKYYSLFGDSKIAIIGAYMSLQWSSLNNKFMPILNDIVEEQNFDNRSVMYYLMALNIFYDSISKKTYNKRKCIDLLLMSIRYSGLFVNNYILYSDIIRNKSSSAYIEHAVKNVLLIYGTKNDKKIQDSKTDLYTDYINEFIKGIYLSRDSFNDLVLRRHMYSSGMANLYHLIQGTRLASIISIIIQKND